VIGSITATSSRRHERWHQAAGARDGLGRWLAAVAATDPLLLDNW
jgi:hypothetical protein